MPNTVGRPHWLSSRPGAVFVDPPCGDAPVAPVTRAGDERSRRRGRRGSSAWRRQWLHEHGLARPDRRARRPRARGRPRTRAGCSQGLMGRWRSPSGSRSSRWPRSRSTADEIGLAMIANLLATLPLAIARRHLAWATGSDRLRRPRSRCPRREARSRLPRSSGSSSSSTCSRSPTADAGRCSRAPVPRNAIEPFDGNDAGFPGVLLLMVVVAAAALGDSRRQRGEVDRRAGRDAPGAWSTRCRTRPRWANAPESPATCTTSSLTTCRRSPSRRRARASRPKGLPEEGRAHFEAIGQTARDALTEMRRLLGVLREDAQRRGDARSTTEPRPPERARGDCPRRGDSGDAHARGHGRDAAARRRPVRVPDPAGGADERPSPCTRCGRWTSSSSTGRTRCASASVTTGPAPSLRISTGTASWECASGRSWSAAR